MAIGYNFNEVKTINVVLYIAERLKRRDFHKIFKILYFSDREYLNQYGVTITGDTYIAMEAGPVPTKTYDIFKIVRGDSYMQDTKNLGRFFAVSNWMFIHPLQKANVDDIAPTERQVIDDVIDRYGDMSYDEIKEKSHDVAWRSTARDYPISFENMAMEAGMDEEDISYLEESAKLQNEFC
ncbi:MAG: Panacea domain-containing protein [Prevotella sp.]